MPKEAPEWQAHHASGYDGAMTARCDRLLAEIVADSGRRQAILADPRDLHRELFDSFTPADYPEYARERDLPAKAVVDHDDLLEERSPEHDAVGHIAEREVDPDERTEPAKAEPGDRDDGGVHGNSVVAARLTTLKVSKRFAVAPRKHRGICPRVGFQIACR